MAKRFFWTATLATLLASAGCMREMCARHGYFSPAPPPAYAPGYCVPAYPQCASPPAAYAPPTPNWNEPARNTCPPGCVTR